MTRFARASDGNRKRPLDASDWSELKADKSKKRKKEKSLKVKAKKIKAKQSEDKEKESKSAQNEALPPENKLDEPTVKTNNLESRLRNLSQERASELQLKEAYKKVKRSEDRRIKRIQKKQDELVSGLVISGNASSKVQYFLLLQQARG